MRIKYLITMLLFAMITGTAHANFQILEIPDKLDQINNSIKELSDRINSTNKEFKGLKEKLSRTNTHLLLLEKRIDALSCTIDNFSRTIHQSSEIVHHIAQTFQTVVYLLTVQIAIGILQISILLRWWYDKRKNRATD